MMETKRQLRETIANLREQIREERNLNDRELAKREAEHIREVNDLRIQLVQALKDKKQLLETLSALQQDNRDLITALAHIQATPQSKKTA